MYKHLINDVPDFPSKGILFRDISPLLKSNEFSSVIFHMMDLIHELPDYWVGIDSRGFIFASALSITSKKGLIMCRKKGKLPPETISQEYSLEYGTDILEIKPGTGTVVIVDDVYATGGTMEAAKQLCVKAGYTVIDTLTLIDLEFLHGPINNKSLIKYE